jgi:hypothetical protein
MAFHLCKLNRFPLRLLNKAAGSACSAAHLQEWREIGCEFVPSGQGGAIAALW